METMKIVGWNAAGSRFCAQASTGLLVADVVSGEIERDAAITLDPTSHGSQVATSPGSARTASVHVVAIHATLQAAQRLLADR